MENHQTGIAGYNYGATEVDLSPVTLEELELLKKTVGMNDEDAILLQKAGSILEPNIEELVGIWRGVVAANPHLIRYYAGNDQSPIASYRTAVKARFEQWVRDLCFRPLDQAWLNYQHEIGLRHTHLKKNKADGVSAVPHIPLRYLISFTAIINNTVRPFLSRNGHSEQEVDAMHQAWCKMLLLQVTLWSRPYTAESYW